MPRISEVSVARKFNLGNYETLDVGIHAFIGECEDPQQTLAMLEEQIMMYVQRTHPETLGLKQPQTTREPLKPKPQDIKEIFPEDLRELLTFEQKGAEWIIKPRQYLGAENFAKIAEIVRNHNGEYVSAGKSSHFRMPV